DLANATAYVAKVGIGHFTRTIHYATHDCNLHTLEVIGDRSDLRSCLLQIEKCSSTTRAGDIFGLRDSCTRCLQNAERGVVQELLRRCVMQVIPARGIQARRL